MHVTCAAPVAKGKGKAKGKTPAAKRKPAKAPTAEALAAVGNEAGDKESGSEASSSGCQEDGQEGDSAASKPGKIAVLRPPKAGSKPGKVMPSLSARFFVHVSEYNPEAVHHLPACPAKDICGASLYSHLCLLEDMLSCLTGI